MANRDPRQCAKAVQGFWNNERELVKQGQGTRNWTVQEQIEIMNFKPTGGERKNAAAPSYGLDYDKYEGQHMKSAEAYPEYQRDPSNIQALTREEHQQAHNGDFRNPTNGYYNPENGEITDFNGCPPSKVQPRQLEEAYADSTEYQYILDSGMDVLDNFERNKVEMRDTAHDSFKDVLQDYDQRKADMRQAESNESVAGAPAEDVGMEM